MAQVSLTASLAYDVANRRTVLTLPNGIVVTYQYDEASHLIGQTYIGPAGVLGDLTYQYDTNGNRTATGGSFARSLIPSAIGSSAYDQANQQVDFGETTQTFDPNGNLSTQTDASGTITYTWDTRNRLVGLSGPSVSASFGYDALGRRIQKVINGVATTYQYDGLDVIRESGGGGDASYLRTLAVDEALARTDATGSTAYLSDVLGTTLALADFTGSPVTTYTFAPFGEVSIAGLASPNPFQYTGRENDLPGLYYYRARYHDPIRSRFVSNDPIGIAGGLNPYRYAGNNPVRYSDALGLAPCDDCPSGEWSSFSYPGSAMSAFFGGGGTIARTIYWCKDNDLVCEGSMLCFGGGLIVAAGIGFDFGGFPKFAAGVQNVHSIQDFKTFSSGFYMAGGPVSALMTNQGVNQGVAKSVGAGIAYVSCITFSLICNK